MKEHIFFLPGQSDWDGHTFAKADLLRKIKFEISQYFSWAPWSGWAHCFTRAEILRSKQSLKVDSAFQVIGKVIVVCWSVVFRKGMVIGKVTVFCRCSELWKDLVLFKDTVIWLSTLMFRNTVFCSVIVTGMGTLFCKGRAFEKDTLFERSECFSRAQWLGRT